MTTSAAPNVLLDAAQRLRLASERGVPCAPVRDLIGAHDVVAAYGVQQRLTQQRQAAGAQIRGRKIGLTSVAVQQQLGVDRPDFGVLFDDMEVASGSPVPMERLLQPRVEAELAFVLCADLDDDLGDAAIRRAVDHAVVALEIVDSRIAGWDISFADTVADNASAGLFVLGEDRLSLDRFEPRDTEMVMRVDGTTVSTGDGRACLGDPLAALAWLARTAAELGDPLRAGQVVLSGALGPMADVRPGTTVVAELSVGGRTLGSVTALFPEVAA